MAILQNIRVKLGVLISVIIALSLLSFIIDPSSLQSALQSTSKKYDVGQIAGKRVSYSDFQEEIDRYTKINELLTGSTAQNEETHQQIRDAAWQGLLDKHLFVKNATAAGITVGEDGATHQTMEDVALMRALPGMAVVVPCDYNQTKNATVAAAEWNGPVYLRFGRPAVPNFTPADEPFVIGKVYNLNEGKDVSIITNGHLVWEALLAAEALEAEGISAEVLNVATVKPLDAKAIVASLKKTGCAVVAEEHNWAGGLGEAVAGVAARELPTPIEFVNGEDKFGQSGTPAELMKAWGFDAAGLVAAAKKAIARK